jgi:gallate dioxygenase
MTAPYVFDLERSARGLRLNRFLHSLVSAAVRAQFAADPEQAMRAAGLDDDERAMLGRRDWRALMDHGASFFCLEKFARAIGVSNPEMIAAFRGETLAEFLQTRRVPGAR